MRASFLGVYGAERDFESAFDGFLGLAPFKNKGNQTEKLSLLKHLLDRQLISKPMFAFYISRNMKIQSSIKFGGMDQSAIQQNYDLRWVNSVNADTPSFGLYTVVAQSNVVRMDADRYLLMEPQFPFMYVPMEDFKEWMITISRTFPDVICNYSPRGVCYWR